ncbi:MAG: group 1 truncated hemoglobin [Methanotrichaceae archaeon]
MNTAKTSLYERLGGYNTIAAIVDDLMRRMGSDQKLAKYFVGHGNDSLKNLRQLQVNMICEATGGPCYYTGRDMKTIHKGIGIDGISWQTMISHLIGSMESFKVEDAEQKEILNMLNGIKGDIVERP